MTQDCKLTEIYKDESQDEFFEEVESLKPLSNLIGKQT